MRASRAIVGLLIVTTACTGESDSPVTTLPLATTTVALPSRRFRLQLSRHLTRLRSQPKSPLPRPLFGLAPCRMWWVSTCNWLRTHCRLPASTSCDPRRNGAGAVPVVDRNWTVVDQTPAGGTVIPLSGVVDLGAVKDEEF